MLVWSSVMALTVSTSIDLFLYGLLFVLFMVFFGIDSIEKYQKKDTIFVTSQESTNGIEAPAVSLIALNDTTGFGWKAHTNQTGSFQGKYNMAFLFDHCQEINFTNLEDCITNDSFGLTDFLTTATFTMSPLTVGQLYKTSWTEDVSLTTNGRIFTWNPQRNITPHYTQIVFLSLYKKFTYYVFVHDLDFYMISTNRFGATPAFWEIMGNTMQTHYQEIKLVKHKRLNIDRQPCEEDENYRMLDCVKESIAEQVGCRLPWDRATKQDREICTTRDQFHHFDSFLFTSTTDEINQVRKMTGCLTPCSYREYKFLTSVPKTLYAPIVPADQIGIGLWAMSRETEINEEVSEQFLQFHLGL